MSNTNTSMTDAARSTNVASFGYNAERSELTVTFRRTDASDTVVSGIYHEVPMDLHQALVNANTNGGSVGRVLNEQIKKAGYRFERSPA